MANAQRMATATAEQLGIDAHLVLVSSTGVIGQQLPMDKVESGIQTAASALSTEGGSDAAGSDYDHRYTSEICCRRD